MIYWIYWIFFSPAARRPFGRRPLYPSNPVDPACPVKSNQSSNI